MHVSVESMDGKALFKEALHPLLTLLAESGQALTAVKKVSTANPGTMCRNAVGEAYGLNCSKPI